MQRQTRNEISIPLAHHVGGSSTNRPKDSHQLTSSGYYGWRARVTRVRWRRRTQRHREDGERGRRKKIYLLSLLRCQRRDAYLLIGTLCRVLSDLGGFRRKWAFKYALGPFTSARRRYRKPRYYDSRCPRDRARSDAPDLDAGFSRKFYHHRASSLSARSCIGKFCRVFVNRLR